MSLILDSNLARDKVLLNPEVTAVPMEEHPDELKQKFPGVFPACAATPAVARQKQDFLHNHDIDLEDSFMVNDINAVSSVITPALFNVVAALKPKNSAPLWLRSPVLRSAYLMSSVFLNNNVI